MIFREVKVIFVVGCADKYGCLAVFLMLSVNINIFAIFIKTRTKKYRPLPAISVQLRKLTKFNRRLFFLLSSLDNSPPYDILISIAMTASWLTFSLSDADKIRYVAIRIIILSSRSFAIKSRSWSFANWFDSGIQQRGNKDSHVCFVLKLLGARHRVSPCKL